jgi:hypothetical protein
VRAWRAGAAGIGVALVLMGCASHRRPGDAYRSSKGYRVSLPGGDWRRVSESRADLELRHAQAPAGILVNATCDPRVVHRPLDALPREILAGFTERVVQERDAGVVSGREAVHMVVEGQEDRGGDRVGLELYVLKGDRCVYDLVYAAPPADFPRWRGDFQRLVETFTLE